MLNRTDFMYDFNKKVQIVRSIRMKRIISRMLSVMMIAVCVFVLSACSGSGSGGSADPSGSYELTAATAADTGSSASEFDMMKEMGMTATLTIEKDGTGLLNMFGTPVNVTVDKEAKTIKIYDQTLDYTYVNKVFSFVWENTGLEFTKTE